MPVLTESSQRTGYMPGSKDEHFLPRISQRGSSSDSDSLSDYRKGGGYPRIPSSADTSTSSSPVKLPNINGKSKSNSISSLSNATSPNRGAEERRSNLCRSPSCPSNLGFWYDRDDDTNTPTPENYLSSYPPTKRESCDLKLPSISDRNSMCSGFSQSTYRSRATQRSPTRYDTSRDNSPVLTRREHVIPLSYNRDAIQEVLTPRTDQPPDSQRSLNQSALLLPIRNSESRLSLKKKKKKKKDSSRQNTDVSMKSHNNSDNVNVNMDRVKSMIGTMETRGYFSEVEDTTGGRQSDDRCINRVTEENVVVKHKENKTHKRQKLKKRLTDNKLYFEREMTQVNA